MKIILFKFKCHYYLEQTFNPKSITYLSGKSGSGKTTIFEAIAWCLYGVVYEVWNRRTPKDNMYVVIYMDNGDMIARQRNPDQLMVNNVYFDKLAQSYVNGKYGTYSNWSLVGINVQGECHPLMVVSPSKRSKMLNDIIFLDDGPDIYIDKVSKAIGFATTEYNDISNKLILERNKYEEVIQQCKHLAYDSLLSNDKVESYNASLLDLDCKLRALQSQYENEKAKCNQYDGYKQMLNRLKVRLLSTNPNGVSIDTFNQQISELEQHQINYTNYSDKLKRLTLLKSQLTSTKLRLVSGISPFEYSQSDLSRIIKEQNTYDAYISQCTRLGIIPGTEDDRLNVLKLSLDSIWMLDVRDKRDNITAQLHRFRSQLPKVVCDRQELTKQKDQLDIEIQTLNAGYQSEINNIRSITCHLNKDDVYRNYNEQYQQISGHITKCNNEKTELEKSKNNLSCPTCDTQLKYIGNKLIISDVVVFDPVKHQELNHSLSQLNDKLKDIATDRDKSLVVINSHTAEIETQVRNLGLTHNNQIHQLRSKLSEINNKIRSCDDYDRINTTITSLGSALDALPEVNIPNNVVRGDKVYLQSMIAQISGINKCRQPEISYTVAKSQNDQYLIVKQIEQIEKEISDIGVLSHVPNRSNELLSLRQQLTDISKITNSINDTIDQINILGDIPDAQLTHKHISNVSDQISQIKLLLNNSTLASRAQQQYYTVSNTENEQNNKHIRLTNLHRLKNVIIQTQYDVHSQYMLSLNSYISKYSSSLFEQAISIKISTSKKLKSGVERSIINIGFSYLGGEFSDIRSLCGGEKLRASVLVTFAFNRIFDSPILLLDESVTCLQADQRVDVTDIIKNSLGDKIVVLTCHELALNDNIQHVVSLDRIG